MQSDLIQTAVKMFIRGIGEDENREGLRETPRRVAAAYEELFSGYSADVPALMTCFEDGACDEMIVLRDVEFTSFCEHHWLPFSGVAHVAYLPNGRVIGLSKLARLVDVYAKRLQIQERLTSQVVAALDEHLKPLGSACVVEASHLCMSCRGVRKPSAVMVTSSLSGVFRSDATARAELFGIISRRHS